MSMKNRTEPGIVIILNGPSAVGKSTIQKKLQVLFEKPYLKLGIDNLLCGPLHETFFSNKEIMWSETSLDNEKPVFTLYFGQDGKKIINAMHKTIGTYARTGNNVVVDYILYDKSWLKLLKQELEGIRVYFVGLTASLEIIEQREKKRATSPQGHARSLHKTVHNGCQYHLFIDTTEKTPDETALIIKKFIEKNPNPTELNLLIK